MIKKCQTIREKKVIPKKVVRFKRNNEIERND